MTVSGFVTMDLVDVEFEEALAWICIPLGLTFRRMDSGYYLVGASTIPNPTFSLLNDTDVVKERAITRQTPYPIFSQSPTSPISG